jgi:hypothetical protein
MDEKLRFVARYLDGEKIAALCREFGISRVTGHSIIDRYRDSGMEAFTDRSRRPYRQANQLPMQVEKLILLIKQEWPPWGAPKVRERLITQYPSVRPRPRARCTRSWQDMAWSRARSGDAGQKVGVKEEDEGIWQISFMHYEIGYFDLDTCRVEPVDNPFGPKVLSMSPV